MPTGTAEMPFDKERRLCYRAIEAKQRLGITSGTRNDADARVINLYIIPPRRDVLEVREVLE